MGHKKGVSCIKEHSFIGGMTFQRNDSQKIVFWCKKFNCGLIYVLRNRC